MAKQIVKTFKKKTTVSQVHVEERRSMATHKEANHNISLNYKKRIEHHPLKKTHYPIENHGHIKRKCWVSEIHDNRNVGRISH